MAIVWADVSDLAPELASLMVAAQNAILVYVNAAFDATKFATEELKMARVYLAAHLGTITKGQGSVAAGPVISESAHGLSRTYAVVSQNVSSSFSRTSYGATLQWMLDTSKARLPMVLR